MKILREWLSLRAPVELGCVMKSRLRMNGYPRVNEILGQVPGKWVIAILRLLNSNSMKDGESDGADSLSIDESQDPYDIIKTLNASLLRNMELAAISILDQSEDQTDKLADAMKTDSLNPEQLAAYRTCEGKVARSAWRYLFDRPFFDQVERTNRLHNFRDVKRLFDAYLLSAPRPFASAGFDAKAFATQLAAKLDLEEGCDVVVWSDPLSEGEMERWVLAITTAGQFTSVRTYKRNSGLDRLTFLPAREIVLSYAPSSGVIEVCADDRMLRKAVAETFAASVLGVDLKNDPLSWKVFSLWPLRSSLRLEVPPELVPQVERVSVVEFGISMGVEGQSLTLRTRPGKQAEELAPRVVAASRNLPGAGRITHAKIHVEYVKGTNRRNSSFGLTIAGANSCSLTNQRDPERRRLGEILLERWGMMVRFRDLRQEDFASQFRALLSLLDHGGAPTARDTFEFLGADIALLSQSALIRRKGLEDVSLIDRDDVPVQSAEVGSLREDGERDLVLSSGAVVSSTPDTFTELYSVDVDRIVHKVSEVFGPLGLKGKFVRETNHVWRLGDIQLDGKKLPVWLVCGIADAKSCGAADRHLRGMPNLVNGIVFSAGDSPFVCLATHPLIPLASCLMEATTGLEIDPVALAQAYARAIILAQAGEGVVFKKWKPGLAQLIVPGQRPWTIDTAVRVRIVENLYDAYREGAPGLSVSDTVEGTNFVHPQPAFGKLWKEINGTYIRPVGRALWAIAAVPLAK